MLSIDEVQDILSDLADELPDILFKELNGGILLLPQAKESPYARRRDLWILGEYNYSRSMGKYIVIYYGSFERLFGHLPEDELIKELRKTLRHEFRHHIEGLSGEAGLEKEDREFIEKYLAGY